MIRTKSGFVLLLVVLALAACTAKEEAAAPADPQPMEAPMEEPMAVEESAGHHAVATLQAKQGSTVSGTIHFEQASGSGPVTVVAEITGASAGSHGFHIHEEGDCSAADFTSAGGHFNPADVPHGGPQDAERHAGDLGNIEIGADGSGTLKLSSDLITLAEEEPNSILGRAVILHQGADDLTSQPSGAAGARIACGVIAPADS